MTPDLLMLTLCVVLAFVQVMPISVAQNKTWGPKVVVSNRENTPPLPAWGNRSIAAHRNLLENLPLFAVLVLVAHVTGLANDMTALGAEIFVGARALYAVAYIVGTPLRSVLFVISFVGENLILLQLF